jgi:hypothetical protein
MALTVFKSTDPSAPVLSGTVGSLVALLDACLVNGYTGKTALGWGRPFSSTNAAVYRAPSGLQHYLQITDNGTDTNGARTAFGVAFETMTAFNTGTGLFPTAAQLASGSFWHKSVALDATARQWTLIGDDRTFYFVAKPDNASALIFPPCGFGEYASYKSGDAYNTFHAAGGITNTNGVTNSGLALANTIGAVSASAVGFYTARSYTQVGTSQPLYVIGPLNTGATLGSTGITYPNAVDSGLYVTPIPIAEALTGGPIRGRMRGMFAPLHITPLANYDQVSGVVGAPGITLIALSISQQNTLGQVLIDITGPW